MKQLFFTLVVLAIPVVAMGVLLYFFGHGLYTVLYDWIEKKQLAELREQARLRAQQRREHADAASDRDATPPAPKPSPTVFDPLPRKSKED